MTHKLRVRIGEIRQETGHYLTGVIAVACQGRWFPERNWDDLSPGVVAWWSHELSRYFQRRVSRLRLPFLDGSYGIAVQRTKTNDCTVALLPLSIGDPRWNTLGKNGMELSHAELADFARDLCTQMLVRASTLRDNRETRDEVYRVRLNCIRCLQVLDRMESAKVGRSPRSVLRA